MAATEVKLPGAKEKELTPGQRMMLIEVLAEAERRGIDLSDDLFEVQGPQDDDELWEAVLELTGYKIPRVAVCTDHDHVAPFTVFADMYFERRTDVLCIGNRGGGKTTISGFLHGAKCRWHPKYKSAVAGAVEKQGQRAYAEFKRFTRHIAAEIVSSLQSKTIWTNESETEVLGGTIKALNGPHPHLAQFDEVELAQSRRNFEEFQNMAQGDVYHAAQNLLTSTRKTPGGLVQSIIDENEEAQNEGLEPAWDIMIFCVFETMANVPQCGTACTCPGQHKPEETGCKGCGCDKVVKGKWDDGSPRTFASVCNGRGLKAQGFVRLQDVQNRFKRLSRFTWEAQQECLRPNPEGLVHYWFDAEKHVLGRWLPKQEYGPVYRTWDWGGENPHAVLFVQKLKVPVKVRRDPNNAESEIVLSEGSLIVFDEIYHPRGSFRDLGLEVFARTEQWQELGYEWDVEWDFCDPAGLTAKQDVKQAASENEYPVPAFRSIGSRVEDSLEKHISMGEDDLLWVVGTMAPNTVREYGLYRWPDEKPNKNKPTKPMDKDDHTMDAFRYLIWNLYRLSRRKGGEAPSSDHSDHPTRTRQEMEDLDKREKMPNAGAPVASTPAPSYVGGSPNVGGERAITRRANFPSVRRGP